MTWEIVVGIIALVGFAATIGGAVWKLSALIAELKTAIKELTKAVGELRGDNAAEHADMKGQIRDHEKRIGRLEGGRAGN